MEIGQHSVGLKRLKERQGVSTAPMGSDGAAGARSQVLQWSRTRGKEHWPGNQEPSAKSALRPQVRHFTWGLIIHGSFDNLCSLYPTELELWGAAGQIMVERVCKVHGIIIIIKATTKPSSSSLMRPYFCFTSLRNKRTSFFSSLMKEGWNCV